MLGDVPSRVENAVKQNISKNLPSETTVSHKVRCCLFITDEGKDITLLFVGKAHGTMIDVMADGESGEGHLRLGISVGASSQVSFDLHHFGAAKLLDVAFDVAAYDFRWRLKDDFVEFRRGFDQTESLMNRERTEPRRDERVNQIESGDTVTSSGVVNISSTNNFETPFVPESVNVVH